MKKAPKRYKTGGSVYEGDPKKKKAISDKSTEVLTPNLNYPTAEEQLGFNKPISKIGRTYTNVGGGTDYNVPIEQAGSQVGSGRKVTISNTGMKIITNPDGSVEYYDQMGRPVTPMSKSKGGEVKKMKMAPKRGKKNC